MQSTTFRARRIGTIDTQWQAVFNDYWPAYRAWFRRHKRSDINSQQVQLGRRQLASFMPEMLPCYERFLEASDDDPVAAQFLTGFQPPAYLLNCCQAVLLNDEPVLIRNYDLTPDLSENLLTRSDWLGQEIIGTNECLWGLDDGMNKAGLAASVTFGGSNRVGAGFGIPFIMRYLLQSCETVEQGIKLLQRVPSHMAYNVTLVDRRGSYSTVMLAPGRAAIVTREPCITNHQMRVTWPEQAAFSRTLERKQFLDDLLLRGKLNEQRLLDAFLARPLRCTDYSNNFGTVYTAVYRPMSGTMAYHWPAKQAWRHSFADFNATDKTVRLGRHDQNARVHNHVISGARSDYGLATDLRQQLLQGLVYLPASTVVHADALERLKRNLLGDKSFTWNDYAQQMARVWCKRPCSTI